MPGSRSWPSGTPAISCCFAGEPPVLRIEGRVSRTDGPVLDGVDIEDMVLPDSPPHAQRAYRQGGIADASRRIAGLGRFRINLHRERGRAAAAIRMLPARVPTLASLELPAGRTCCRGCRADS